MSEKRKKIIPPNGYHYVFVAYRTLQNGQRIYARNYGLRAFPMLVKD